MDGKNLLDCDLEANGHLPAMSCSRELSRNHRLLPGLISEVGPDACRTLRASVASRVRIAFTYFTEFASFDSGTALDTQSALIAALQAALQAVL